MRAKKKTAKTLSVVREIGLQKLVEKRLARTSASFYCHMTDMMNITEIINMMRVEDIMTTL